MVLFSRLTTHLGGNRVRSRLPCAVCDQLISVRDQVLLSPNELPNKHLLKPHEMLARNERVMATFKNYPGDSDKVLDNHVLSKFGFQKNAPYKMHVGKECLKDLKRGKIPEAAFLANGFYVGTLPDRFQTMSFVERAAAYPIRIKGHVAALESRRVNNAGGTAKRSLRGTSFSVLRQ